MARKRTSSRQQEGVSKRKKDIPENQQGLDTDENETLLKMCLADFSEKEKELGSKEELDGIGISDGVVVHDAKLDNLSEQMRTMKKELEEKINAGFKALREEIDAGFKSLRKEISARKEQQKDLPPKSSKPVARFASIPVPAHTPEIEALLKEVTRSTSSEDNTSKTKTSSSSDKFTSSSSEEVEVHTVAPRSFPATQKKGPAPTRRSSRIAAK